MFISVKEAKEGQRLAQDVFRDGRVCLLSKGSVLTRKYIEGLKKNGIEYICVYDS